MITGKFRRALVTAVSVSLLGNLTIGCASAAPRLTTYDWELSLGKGEAAPYSGVLVPEDAYRYYQADSMVYPDCKAKLKEAVQSCSAAQDEGWLTPKQLIFGVLGFALGFGLRGESR